MEQRKTQLTERIVVVVRDLPEDKVAEVLDFASDLRNKHDQRRPERGSPETILQTLHTTGGLQFEPGELNALLAEIEQARDSDLDERGEPEQR